MNESNGVGTLTEKLDMGMCSPKGPRTFLPSLASHLKKTSISGFVSSQDLTFNLKSQISKISSSIASELEMKSVPIKASNWAKIQFTWLHFVK